MGVISGATQTVKRRMKMSPRNMGTYSQATGPKTTKSEMRMSQVRRSLQSIVGRPVGTEAMGVKTRKTQLSTGTTSPATGATAIKTRMRMKLCPVSITIISSGMDTEAMMGKMMKDKRRRRRRKRRSPLSMDTRPTGTEAMGVKRMRMSQMDTIIMAPATGTKAMKKMTMMMTMMMMMMMMSPLNIDTRLTGTKATGLKRMKMSQMDTIIATPATGTEAMKKMTMMMMSPLTMDTRPTGTEVAERKRMRMSPMNTTITAPATGTEATKKKMMMMMMMMSPLSMDTRPTGTKTTERKRLRLSQVNTTIMSLTTGTKATETRKKMRMCPLNVGTRVPNMSTMAL